MEIIIADYIGYCDNLGNPIGHTIKTINEAIKILENNYKIHLAIPKIFYKYFKDNSIKISYEINNYKESRTSKIKKIRYILKKIFIINRIIKECNNIWFINTDFWIFFILTFYKNKNKKIYVTNYIDYYDKSNNKNIIRSFFYKQAIKNIEIIFTTNKNIYFKNEKYISDYIYENEKYEKFISKNKIEEVVFAGTINKSKDIKGMIEAFNKNGQKLLICGKFNTEEFYKEMYSIANENIEIINKYLSYEEYYKLLGKYKFVILPYKEIDYKNRSSGVVLETIFCDSVPILPQFMAKSLGVDGIKYIDIDNLKNFNVNNYTYQEIDMIIKNNEIKKNSCDINKIKNIYRQAFGVE